MNGFNKVIIAGNLTRDPETRHLPSGAAIVTFGVAVNRTWKDSDGQKKEECTFVDVTAFGKTGEVIAQYMRKGKPILVEGRLRTESWDDKQTGQKRSKLSVVLESFTFLGDGNAGGSPTPAQREPAKRSEPAPVDEDDVPFRSPLPSSQRQSLGIPFHKLA